jgi:hypothetical protein
MDFKSFRALAVLFLLPGLEGCASFVNGLKQPVEIISDTPGAQVAVDGGQAVPLPVIVDLQRSRNHRLSILSPAGDSLGHVEFVKRMSGWIWGNAMFSYFGLGGALIDFLDGAAYNLRPTRVSLDDLPEDIQVAWFLDPWRSGVWRASLGYYLGMKMLPKGLSVDDRVQPDLGIQAVLAQRDWPLELVVDGYFYSAARALEGDNFAILNGGVRKTFDVRNDQIHPYLSGGVTWMRRSTQGEGGLPLGMWARTGVDVRLGHRLFIGPFLGLTKYETTTSGRNTGGPTAGLTLGLLW